MVLNNLLILHYFITVLVLVKITLTTKLKLLKDCIQETIAYTTQESLFNKLLNILISFVAMWIID